MSGGARLQKLYLMQAPLSIHVGLGGWIRSKPRCRRGTGLRVVHGIGADPDIAPHWDNSGWWLRRILLHTIREGPEIDGEEEWSGKLPRVGISS